MQLFWRIIFYSFCAFLLFLIGAWIYIFHLGGLENIANNKIESIIKGKHNLQVSIGEINGDLITGIIIENINLFYDDGITRYQLLELPQLEAAYSIKDLWRSEFAFGYLHLESPQIMVKKDSLGKWLVPDFSGSGKSGVSTLNFSVGELVLNNGNIAIVENDDTLKVNNILLWLAVEIDENNYAVELDRLEFDSNKERVSIDAAGGKITYAEKNLLFEDMILLSNDTRIRVGGNVNFTDKPFGKISMIADNVNLADITTYVGPSLKGILDINANLSFNGLHIIGSADLAGTFMNSSYENLHVDLNLKDKFLTVDTVYGTIFGDCSINGVGELDFGVKPEIYHLTADVRNFNLKNLVPKSFETDLNGSLELNGESFRSKSLLLNINTELFESYFDNYPLQEAAGNIIVTTDSIVFADSLMVKYYENEFYTTGCIDYRNDMNLDIKINLANLDRYKGILFIDQPGGRGYVHVAMSGKTSDPNVKGYFASDSVWIYGLYSDSMYAGIDIDRFFTGKKGNIDIEFYDGTIWDFPYDTGFAYLTIDSNLIGIESVNITSEYTKLNCNGSYDYEAYPGLLEIDTLDLNLYNQPFHNNDKIIIGVDSLGFLFTQTSLGNTNAMLSVVGRTGYDESLDLSLAVHRVPMAPWINLFDTTLNVSGYLSCNANLSGDFLNPEFTLDGKIDSLIYKDLFLGDLYATLGYNKKLLTIDSVTIKSYPGKYIANGTLHADLAFTTNGIERLPELPMDIYINADDNRFDLVSFIMPSVERIVGLFHADIHLSGTPNDPHLEGEAYIIGEGSRNSVVELKYFDLEHTIYTDSAGVTMKDNKIIIDHIKLYSTDNKKPNGRKRYAEVRGEITVKAYDTLYYDLDIKLPREFPYAYELDEIKGKVEGELHVEGSTPPVVTGDLTLVSTKYYVNFAESNEGSPLMMALSTEKPWDLNINVDILSNYWIKNDDIDAEFAGNLNLIRESGSYRFIGEMEILRGRGFLFDKTFNIDPGSVVMFEGNDTLNPRLDITAITRIAGVRANSIEEDETPEQIEIGIHVTGTLDKPEINPISESGLTREEILPLLIANYYSSDSLSASSQLEQRLMGLGYSQVSQIGARQLSQIGVETFIIDPVYGGESNLLNARVTLGKYWGSRLYTYGRTTTYGQTRQEVGFDYRFHKAFQVEGRRDEDELYHLDLKFHLEF